MASRKATRDRTTVKQTAKTRSNQKRLDTAGRYVLLSEIASGGQSTVYLGQDTALGRAVAVKVLMDRDRYAEIRIKREARVLARLRHPGICQIFDIGTSSRGVYLVLELLEGETLRDVLHKIGPLSIVRAVDVVRAVAEALRAAHAHDIVHRDLKPENIAVLPDGNIKLFDFGIAKASRGSKITVGLRIGTNGYMSPEQYMAEPTEPSSDIFSLGCIFHELLTGRLPFETGKDLRAGKSQPLPAAIRDELGEKGTDLIRRMLNVEPDARPSPEEVVDELNELQSRLTKADRGRIENAAIVQLLQVIPAADQSPLTIAEIAEQAGIRDEAIVMAALQMPLAFGALHFSVDDASGVMRLKVTSEVAQYFLKSLALYMRYGLTLIDRWDRRDDPTAADSVPMLGADFVHAMERRRVFQYGLLEPIRIERPVQLIIKGYSRRRRSPVYLMQYDRFAQQYQLIGGRRNDMESALAAIQRVLTKELPHNDLKHGVNCELDLIRDDIVATELSRTVGAFTSYRFSIFAAQFEHELTLGEFDRWVTEEELFSGVLEESALPAWNHRLVRITNALDRGLAALPFSFRNAID